MVEAKVAAAKFSGITLDAEGVQVSSASGFEVLVEGLLSRLEPATGQTTFPVLVLEHLVSLEGLVRTGSSGSWACIYSRKRSFESLLTLATTELVRISLELLFVALD